jgi:urease accessory protein
MAMDTPMRMPTANLTTTMTTATEASVAAQATSTQSLLPLLWLASPALPVGGFSYSEGLEAAVAQGLVHDATTACVWLKEQLLLSQARGDLSVLAAMIRAWRHDPGAERTQRVTSLNCWVQQTRESAELRLQTEQMGRSLLDWLRQRGWAQADDLALCQRLSTTYPMVMGLALASTEADPASALTAFAFGWAENMTQAAIKSIPLGQSAGQAILAELSAHMATAVQEALARGDETRQSFAPMLAIVSAQHETQYSRLFRS